MNNTTSMENTLGNIKMLQDKETSLYSSFGVSVAGEPLNSDDQEKILDDINSLTDLRVNLIRELKNQYNALTVNVAETSNDIKDEVASIEVMEQQLNEKKKQISKLKNIEINKLRMADINNYYADRSEYIASMYLIVVVMLASICVVLVVRKVFFFIPSIIYNSLLGIILIIGLVYIFYKLRDLYSRDKMNFNNYDFSHVEPKTVSPSVYEYDMKQLSKARNVILGQESFMNLNSSYVAYDPSGKNNYDLNVL